MPPVVIIKAGQIISLPKICSINRVYHQRIEGAEYKAAGLDTYANKYDP